MNSMQRVIVGCTALVCATVLVVAVLVPRVRSAVAQPGPNQVPPSVDKGEFGAREWWDQRPDDFDKWLDDTKRAWASGSTWKWLLGGLAEALGLGAIMTWLLVKIGPNTIGGSVGGVIESFLDRLRDKNDPKTNEAVELLVSQVREHSKQSRFRK